MVPTYLAIKMRLGVKLVLVLKNTIEYISVKLAQRIANLGNAGWIIVFAGASYIYGVCPRLEHFVTVKRYIHIGRPVKALAHNIFSG
jgi:hypothetical protein